MVGTLGEQTCKGADGGCKATNAANIYQSEELQRVLSENEPRKKIVIYRQQRCGGDGWRERGMEGEGQNNMVAGNPLLAPFFFSALRESQPEVHGEAILERRCALQKGDPSKDSGQIIFSTSRPRCIKIFIESILLI